MADIRTILAYSLECLYRNCSPVRICRIGLIKAAPRCAEHAADRNKRLLSDSVCRCRYCTCRSLCGACYDTLTRKEDRLHRHDMDARCRIKFRIKLSAYSLFGPHRCSADNVPRIPARFRADCYLFNETLQVRRERSFVAKSVCASGIVAVFLFLWNPSGLLSIVLSIALAAAIYLTIMFALRGFTIQETKLIYEIYKGSR